MGGIFCFLVITVQAIAWATLMNKEWKTQDG
jgi:hypothetical protein